MENKEIKRFFKKAIRKNFKRKLQNKDIDEIYVAIDGILCKAYNIDNKELCGCFSDDGVPTPWTDAFRMYSHKGGSVSNRSLGILYAQFGRKVGKTNNPSDQYLEFIYYDTDRSSGSSKRFVLRVYLTALNSAICFLAPKLYTM
ncbi:hypothetical protein WN51_14174 [Melipona quadrifasciata]|uniref:Uncharacterized protein n=1 Tax=Melipona quadrifasciata TaxID=166423 RepID=A0A0N0U552_9HYME|nr:hypothetical protein WN51_14174 [Melipona quadrifasciata]